MMSNKMILTGFEPFGDSDVNPSIIACRSFDDKVINDFRVKVFEIPLSFYEIKGSIERIMTKELPSAIVCTGQSPRPVISLERIAINIADIKKSAYNCGTKPVDLKLEVVGQDGYFTKLPIKLINKNLERNKIPSEISNSAGTFGCNQIFYHLMHYINVSNLNIPAGFLHIPSMPEQVIGKKLPSMSIETTIKGIEIVIKTIIEIIEKDKQV